jgi:hypothetical protein
MRHFINGRERENAFMKHNLEKSDEIFSFPTIFFS